MKNKKPILVAVIDPLSNESVLKSIKESFPDGFVLVNGSPDQKDSSELINDIKIEFGLPDPTECEPEVPYQTCPPNVWGTKKQSRKKKLK